MNEISCLKPRILRILKKHGVKRAGIFGSFARGEQKKGSDVDVLIEAPGGIGLFGLARIELDLESATGRKVDLLTYRSIHPLLRRRILSEEVLFLWTGRIPPSSCAISSPPSRISTNTRPACAASLL
ncbi:MAG: nucleotidyltransferase family protein [Candidatus Micrarchaeota archaeon]